MSHHDVDIPWVNGFIRTKRMDPETTSDVSLPGGRWAFHPVSTIPFVTVQVAAANASKLLTWGDMIEIPRGLSGMIRNDSFHAGDVAFSGLGNCCGVHIQRPAAIAIPTKLNIDGEGPTQTLTTNFLDTRMARRAYLWIPSATLVNPIPYNVRLSTPTRGVLNVQPIPAQDTNELVFFGLMTGVNVISLGFGAGTQPEPAPGTNIAPELRPMALLDRVRVRFLAADAALNGITQETTAYFNVEY